MHIGRGPTQHPTKSAYHDRLEAGASQP